MRIGEVENQKMAEPNDNIKECIVNDYFTPNIKAEVILNALLTPYIANIIKEQASHPMDGSRCPFTGELALIAKEMSVIELGKEGNIGTKIDYVLGDDKWVYLVELKTTDSSINKDQAERYLDNCRGKTFGDVFGNKLLSIMQDAFGKTYCEELEKKLSNNAKESQRPEAVLKEAFSLVFDENVLKKFHDIDTSDKQELFKKFRNIGTSEIPEPDKEYTKAARELIKKAHWTQKDSTRSRKYLYTAGQILEYLGKHPGRTLWDKGLRLIYLTPYGKCFPEELRKAEGFYIGSYSLSEANKYLKTKQEDNLARLLSGIIKDVYGIKGK